MWQYFSTLENSVTSPKMPNEQKPVREKKKKKRGNVKEHQKRYRTKKKQRKTNRRKQKISRKKTNEKLKSIKDNTDRNHEQKHRISMMCLLQPLFTPHLLDIVVELADGIIVPPGKTIISLISCPWLINLCFTNVMSGMFLPVPSFGLRRGTFWQQFRCYTGRYTTTVFTWLSVSSSFSTLAAARYRLSLHLTYYSDAFAVNNDLSISFRRSIWKGPLDWGLAHELRKLDCWDSDPYF